MASLTCGNKKQSPIAAETANLEREPASVVAARNASGPGSGDQLAIHRRRPLEFIRLKGIPLPGPPEQTPGVAEMTNRRLQSPGACRAPAISRARVGRSPHGPESFPAGGEAPPNLPPQGGRNQRSSHGEPSLGHQPGNLGTVFQRGNPVNTGCLGATASDKTACGSPPKTAPHPTTTVPGARRSPTRPEATRGTETPVCRGAAATAIATFRSRPQSPVPSAPPWLGRRNQCPSARAPRSEVRSPPPKTTIPGSERPNPGIERGTTARLPTRGRPSQRDYRLRNDPVLNRCGRSPRRGIPFDSSSG